MASDTAFPVNRGLDRVTADQLRRPRPNEKTCKGRFPRYRGPDIHWFSLAPEAPLDGLGKKSEEVDFSTSRALGLSIHQSTP